MHFSGKGSYILVTSMKLAPTLKSIFLALTIISTGSAQVSKGILSTLKIQGGLGIHQTETIEHLLSLLGENGFASSKTSPHPLYIEEERVYPFNDPASKENAFIQLELAPTNFLVAGVGIQNDRFGNVNGRTPLDEFASLSYRIKSQYIFGGLFIPLGGAFTARGNLGVSLNNVLFELDIRDGYPPTEVPGTLAGGMLMAGLDYTLSQLAAIGLMVRYHAIPDFKIPEIEWSFIGNQLSLPAHNMPIASLDINLAVKLSIY